MAEADRWPGGPVSGRFCSFAGAGLAVDGPPALVVDACRRAGLGARVLLAFVHGYQWLMAGRRSPCRFIPSCSCYAADAIERHGALRGSCLAARRLSRCRPWGGSGVDLVPD